MKKKEIFILILILSRRKKKIFYFDFLFVVIKKLDKLLFKITFVKNDKFYFSKEKILL